MIHLLEDWLGWPDGSVLTNLVASAVVFTAGYFVGVRRHVKALHQKLDGLHQKADIDHQHLVAIRKHHHTDETT